MILPTCLGHVSSIDGLSFYLRPKVGSHEGVIVLTGPRGTIRILQLQAT